MGSKIIIKDTNQAIDIQRGMAIPRVGEVMVLKLKGEKEERIYTVYSIEHFLDLNIPIGSTTQTTVTIEEVKAKKKSKVD